MKFKNVILRENSNVVYFDELVESDFKSKAFFVVNEKGLVLGDILEYDGWECSTKIGVKSQNSPVLFVEACLKSGYKVITNLRIDE